MVIDCKTQDDDDDYDDGGDDDDHDDIFPAVGPSARGASADPVLQHWADPKPVRPASTGEAPTGGREPYA